MDERRRWVCLGLLAMVTVGSSVRAQAVEAEAEAAGATAEAAVVGGAVTVGGQSVDDREESSKFQEYRDVPDGFFLGRFVFDWSKSNWFVDVDAVDLLQDDERVTAGFGRYGTFRTELQYDRIPRWFSNTAGTLFARHGGDLILPPPMREDLEALGTPAAGAQLPRYLTAVQPVDLRFVRETASAAVGWTLRENLAFRSSYAHERRGGTRPLSLATSQTPGVDITEFASPVEFTTDRGSVGLEYATRRWHVAGDLGVSRFSDDVLSLGSGTPLENSVIVDNPLRATDANETSGTNNAAARFLYSVPPDNVALSANLSGGIKVGPWAKLTGSVSRGLNKQDETFLPFSLNAAVPAPADPRGLAVLRGHLADGVPVSRYDGEVDIGVYDVRFTGQPVGWLSFKVFGHSYDYDNDTPEYTVTDYIRADSGLEGIARAALPFAWKKDNLGADLRLRPAERLGVTVGVEQERWDREFRNASETAEDIYKLAVDWTPATWATLHASFRTSERTYDDYNEETFFGEESFPEGEPVANAVVVEQRLFDLANRDQQRFDLLAEITPSPRWGIGLSWNAMRNDYEDITEVEEGGVLELLPALGRQEDETTGWSVDVNVGVSERVTLYADYGAEEFEYDLASRYRPVTAGVAVDLELNNWFSRIRDTTAFYGAGVTAELVPDRWTLDVHALVSDATGRTRASFVPGGATAGDAQDFPDVTNRLSRATVDVSYQPAKNLTVGLGYLWEDYEEEDFARDVMQPWMGAVDPSAAESVFLGWRIPSYDVNLLRALLTYRF